MRMKRCCQSINDYTPTAGYKRIEQRMSEDEDVAIVDQMVAPDQLDGRGLSTAGWILQESKW